MFIDSAKIYVAAGKGGNGCISFRREKFVPFGGPNGGNGGNGGDVVIEASKKTRTLIGFRRKQHFKVASAGDGEGNNRFGKASQTITIQVPTGTLVRDAATGEIMADLLDDGNSLIVAHGGRGGKGNAEYTTATNQAPKQAQPGIPGEEKTVLLELRLVADIGLVGLPNAGKSTLLSRISAARPKIADYPFTTLEPQLGVVQSGSYDFIVADIPGIIEGAHEGKGLGLEFLKHIERTSYLLFMIDISETTAVGSVVETYLLLKKELKEYSEELAGRKYSVAATKWDITADDAREWRELKTLVESEGIEFFTVSSVRGDNIELLVNHLREQLKKHHL